MTDGFSVNVESVDELNRITRALNAAAVSYLCQHGESLCRVTVGRRYKKVLIAAVAAK